ncbi:MAG: inorganic phosphate transporter [Candidatus Krumholzibacteria bacterium]|nr:inorganic phosphate transporter [Candidatus Krumholzibacteria bacterium]MDH3378367.1 inorganic phosphate transporter [Gammaproteobacteria bacterium]
MSSDLTLVVIVVAVALGFDVINGFHDSANSIATIVSTRVLSPRTAVLWAAFFNFAAMLVFAPAVADTISKIVKVTPGDPAYVYVVLAGLVGAIVWDLMTWWWGLPTSSSHALIGGFAGAGVAHAGWDIIRWDKILTTVKFIPLAPLMGLSIGFALMVAVYWLFRRWRPTAVDKLFRRGQLVSAAFYSLGHGGNDAQKTMGIIVALLIASGHLEPDVQLSLIDSRTLWIILSCHAAMAVGTAMGGWRIVRTMGMKITKLKPVGGFCAETAGAVTLFLATHSGIPVSTTHTITGSIIGVGATTKLSGIRWGVAGRIIWAWILTIPAAALVAALIFALIRALHPGI